MKLKVEQIIQMVEGTFCGDAHLLSNVVFGVTTDSRKVNQNELFVPLIGEKFDGHRYVDIAHAEGALISLWQEDRGTPPEHNPVIVVKDTLQALQLLARRYREQRNVVVVGVTGSNGKTTTKDMIAAILSMKYNVCKTKGNLNNHIGLPLTLLQMDEETEVAVVEMGMNHRGEIELLSTLAQPDIAVITNIGDAHLMQLGSREEIARAKFEILVGLRDNGTLIYPQLDSGVSKVLNELNLDDLHRRHTIQVGMDEDSDVYPTHMEYEHDGITFKHNQLPDEQIYVPLLGKHNVWNALHAMTVGKLLDIDQEMIKEALARVKITGMRLEKEKGIKGCTILNDCYNASPTSLKAALKLLEDSSSYCRRIAVLADMLELGEKEVSLHREIGESIDGQRLDYLFVYGELGKHIAEGAEKVIAKERIFVYQDKIALSHHLIELVNQDDLILFKGSRGMFLEEVVYHLKVK
ncbi:UDP-N-acetylmuramoyl-tripeptide--D-alanyl-D-alanine ligase [Longirhabdus pacifica]|uniref:UDP-N-acetylmuramoyl-tripeptide--D-alanyl-D- alanine ligase n=1 Tax=Longirhabdus pacifica TaxID=2305227 RepID=UPI001008D431|nr:UDP-N-acetylmuramoyl-tripeptide--D-alanyl-D-alanine ligase [Longirhabdus pacifica]